MGVTATTNSAATYVPIATLTGNGSNALTFSSIPQTYTDLVIIASGTLNATTDLWFQVGNGTVDTGSDYSRVYMYGNGTTISAGNSTGTAIGWCGYHSSTVPGISLINFMNYSNNGAYKIVLSSSTFYGNTYYPVSLWRGTNPINIITLSTNGSTFPSSFTATLYGIQAA
jgi:hypothetical protein